MKVRKVVFPVDLAGSSYRITPKVRSIVDQLDAELHLIYVLETFEGYNNFFVPHPSLDLMEREDMALTKRHLEEFAEKYFVDRPKTKLVVLHGEPVEQILKYVESEGIDMIIVAGYDQSLLEKAIFGDISEQIARSSPVPVMVINPFVEEKTTIPEVGRPAATHGLVI